MDPTLPPFPEPKPRPSVWWFALGSVLVIAAVAIGVAFFLRLLDGFLTVEARVPADDQAHAVSVGTGSDRFLWMLDTQPADCVISDAQTGGDIQVHPVTGAFTRTGGSGAWVADGTFDPGSGQLSVTCAGTGGPVEIGPAWDIGDFVIGLLLTILVPLVLGGLGTLILVVTGILWAVRPSRT